MKKALLSIASLFLGYQSWQLIYGWENTLELKTGESILIAFLANLFILGAFALAGFAWPTYRILPNRYYHVKNPEKLLLISKNLKVSTYQKFLLSTFWKDKNKQNRYFDGSRSGISNWIKESMSAEFGHLIPFVILTLLAIWGLIGGNCILAFSILILNILANFYPLLLQRTHRARIQLLRNRGLDI